jgi:hypothetical protein
MPVATQKDADSQANPARLSALFGYALFGGDMADDVQLRAGPWEMKPAPGSAPL